VAIIFTSLPSLEHLDELSATLAHDAADALDLAPTRFQLDRIALRDAARGQLCGATLIRHAAGHLSLSVRSLVVAMVETTFGTLLVAPVGATLLLATGRLTAPLAAVALASITGAADVKQRPAVSRVATPLIEPQLLAAGHPAPEAGMDRRRGSWQG
jgi:hypothetical protein